MKKISNRTDKDVVYSCFMACFLTVIICFSSAAFLFWHIDKKNTQEATEILRTVIGYLVNATADEYDEIAKELRHDLIYRLDEKAYIPYIPNTSTDCPTCKSEYEYEYPIYFLANNTGELYHIDTDKQLTGEQMSICGGYDEISQIILSIRYSSSCIISVNQEKEVVSINRMKAIFCDDCIDKILAAIEYQDITSFVIFLPQEQAFYPISENIEIPLENIVTEIYYDKEMREMITQLSW